jgi:DNA-binding response OmpR family regulator
VIPFARRRSQNYIEVATAADALIAIERFNPDISILEWALPEEDVFKMLA